MQISVQADTKALTKHLTRIQRTQIPFATSRALNDVAFDCRSFIQKSLPRRLDRPTKGLISSVRVDKSKKKNPAHSTFSLCRAQCLFKCRVKPFAIIFCDC